MAEIINNKVYLGDDGFIHLDYMGEQNYEKVKADLVPMTELAEKLHKEKKHAYLLVDASDVRKQDSGARKAAAEIVFSVPYDKVALFGAGPFLKNVASLIVKAIGKSNKFGFFDTKEEAARWLQS